MYNPRRKGADHQDLAETANQETSEVVSGTRWLLPTIHPQLRNTGQPPPRADVEGSTQPSGLDGRDRGLLLAPTTSPVHRTTVNHPRLQSPLRGPGRHQCQGDALVPGPTRLPLPVVPSTRTGSRQCRPHIPEGRLLRSYQGNPQLAADGGHLWQPRAGGPGGNSPTLCTAPSLRTSSPREIHPLQHGCNHSPIKSQTIMGITWGKVAAEGY